MIITRIITNTINKLQSSRDKHRKQVAQMRERITGVKTDANDTSISKVVSTVLSFVVYLVASILIAVETVMLFIFVSKVVLIITAGALVAVVLVSFYAMLQALISDREHLESLISNADLQGSGAYCARIVDGGILQWTMEELSAKGAMLDEHDRARYLYGVLVREALEGEGSHLLKHRGLNLRDNITFAMGLTSIENGFSFGGVDILTEPVPIGLNGSGYGVLGISGKATLSSVGFSSTAINNIKAKYKPSRTPSYQAQYIPWGAYLSLNAQDNKMTYAHSKSADIDNKINKVASEWGIVTSLDKFTMGSKYFLMQALYHGASFSEYEGYLNFFAALFVLSSPDNDANRSFDAWTMEVKEGSKRTYSEGSPNRSLFIGDQAHTSIGYKSSPLDFPSVKSSTSIYVALNGVDIGVPLWTYAYKEGSKYNKSGIDKAWNLLKSFTFTEGGTRDRALNFHYGFNAFLQGRAVERDLSKQMSIVGETKTQVVCNGATSTITPGNFIETPGQGQATIDGMSTEKFIESYYKTLSTAKLNHMKEMQRMWGTSNYVASEENPARKNGYIDEYFGVPFYAQMKDAGDQWLKKPWYYGYANSYYANGCMVYSFAYVASALQGVLINPAEMGSIMNATNMLTSSGIYFGKGQDLMTRMGFQSKFINNGASFEGFDDTLDKGGLIIIRTAAFRSTLFTDSEHFQVITGKEVVDGRTMYTTYTSSSYKQSSTLYTKEQLVGSMHREALMVWK